MKKFSIPGFQLSGVSCGLKDNKNSPDLALIVAETICSAAGVFTTNQVKAAPVVYSQKIIKSGRARVIVANSGGANAFTGTQGVRSVQEITGYVAKLLKISSTLVLTASTGKIGPQLPVEKIKNGLEKAVRELTPKGFEKAARAIMTTDTRPKIFYQKVKLSYGTIKIGAIAKGSGMINPNLATMIVCLCTDLKTDPETLAGLLQEAAGKSFNSLTVDNCMSTNDTVFFLASGAGQKKSLKNRTIDHIKFQTALTGFCQDICRQLAADGEGATKVIEVEVTGAATPEAARSLAKSVVASDLVKAAVFGADPNWGRVLAALGSAGCEFDPGRTEVFFGKTRVVSGGAGGKFSYNILKKYLSGKTIKIAVALHQGRYSAGAFGCDLSSDYVKINAKYN